MVKVLSLVVLLCCVGNIAFANPGTNWYMKTAANSGTTDVSSLSNWTQDATGATSVGSLSTFAPTSGTYNFHIQNIANPTLNAPLTIGGGGGTTTLTVGDGTNAITFTIPSGNALTNANAAANVSANATMAIANTTIPTLGTLSAGSTVAYTAISQNVVSATYGNLTIGTSANGSYGGRET